MQNLLKFLNKGVKCGITIFLRLYQSTFSPDHGPLAEFWGTSRCRFYPSCSAYTLQALRQYGLLKGSVVSLKRILRCHPWNSGGYDSL